MRASERLLNEAAWKQPPLRWSHGSQTDGLTVGVGRVDGHPARARSLGLPCAALKALDPDYGRT